MPAWKSVEFVDTLGRKVQLTPVAGGQTYHIYLNRHYFGQIVRNQGEWVTEPQNPALWESADLFILAELVAEANK